MKKIIDKTYKDWLAHQTESIVNNVSHELEKFHAQQAEYESIVEYQAQIGRTMATIPD